MVTCNVMIYPDDDIEVDLTDWGDDTSECNMISMRRG